MIELTTEFSSWYLLGCAVLAGLYTFFLYGRNSRNKELPKWVIQVLAGLRFVSVFLIATLLINVLFQKWITQTEAPLIIVAQDVSESILNSKDSVYYQTDYKNRIQNLESHLGKNYKVETLTFGEEVTISDSNFNYTQKRTNYANVFDEIDARYAGSNLAAVIFASDGLYNIGANPAYYSFKDEYPIYTLGLGDTTQKSDISVRRVLTNDIVYLGNSFHLEVSISADLLSGNTAVLKVLNNGKTIESRKLKITSDHQLFTEKFVFNAAKEGTQRYVITVSEFENEINVINNSSQALIDVLDNRDRVLIVANAPHPDIAAIRNVLIAKESLEVKVVFAEKLEEDFALYNLIIAHGFGSRKYNPIWRKLYKTNIPLWNIIAGRASLSELNEFAPSFSAQGKGGKPNRVFGSVNPDFFLFKISKPTQSFIRKAPPLSAPFADFEGVDKSQELLFQRVGSVETDLPLLYFDKRAEVKTAWLFGEGLWRWKIYNYQESQTHEQFNEFVWKTIQYLSVKEDKSRFRVKVNKYFLENENIHFQAELYDNSYELVNDLEVKLLVTNEVGEEFPYVLNPSGESYALDMGKLPFGVYSYVAEVKGGIGNLKKTGTFIVKMVNVEWSKVSANFSVLQHLSDRTNGQFFTPNQFEDLQHIFDDNSKFPSVSYTSEKKQSVLHEKWLFFLLLSLLALEWLIRKYKGRY